MEETQEPSVPPSIPETPVVVEKPQEQKQEVILLRCLKCGKHDDSLRINGRMTIHQCGRCRTLAWAVSGDLKGFLYRNEETFRQFSIRSVGTMKQTDLWKHFTAVLDGQRVMMADGTYTSQYCVRCEGQPHAGGPLACQCPCHEAWMYRAEMEAKRGD